MPRKIFNELSESADQQFLTGTITERTSEDDVPTCEVSVAEGEKYTAKYFYHCLPDSVEDASAAFQLGDEVILVEQDDEWFVIGMADGTLRYCSVGGFFVVLNDGSYKYLYFDGGTVTVRNANDITFSPQEWAKSILLDDDKRIVICSDGRIWYNFVEIYYFGMPIDNFYYDGKSQTVVLISPQDHKYDGVDFQFQLVDFTNVPDEAPAHTSHLVSDIPDSIYNIGTPDHHSVQNYGKFFFLTKGGDEAINEQYIGHTGGDSIGKDDYTETTMKLDGLIANVNSFDLESGEITFLMQFDLHRILSRHPDGSSGGYRSRSDAMVCTYNFKTEEFIGSRINGPINSLDWGINSTIFTTIGNLFGSYSRPNGGYNDSVPPTVPCNGSVESPMHYDTIPVEEYHRDEVWYDVDVRSQMKQNLTFIKVDKVISFSDERFSDFEFRLKGSSFYVSGELQVDHWYVEWGHAGYAMYSIHPIEGRTQEYIQNSVTPQNSAKKLGNMLYYEGTKQRYLYKKGGGAHMITHGGYYYPISDTWEYSPNTGYPEYTNDFSNYMLYETSLDDSMFDIAPHSKSNKIPVGDKPTPTIVTDGQTSMKFDSVHVTGMQVRNARYLDNSAPVGYDNRLAAAKVDGVWRIFWNGNDMTTIVKDELGISSEDEIIDFGLI